MKTSASRWSKEWLPRVTASAPESISSWQIDSVMPKPPAAFSPLTTTKSSRHFSRSCGNCVLTTVLPLRPTTSPMNKRRIRSGVRASDQFALRQYKIEPLIVRLVRQAIAFGDAIGHPHGERATLGSQRGQRAIVVAGAIADAMTAPIETGERYEKQIGVERRRFRQWLGNSHRAFSGRIARPPASK